MKGSEVFVRSLSWVLSCSPACSQSASSLCRAAATSTQTAFPCALVLGELGPPWIQKQYQWSVIFVGRECMKYWGKRRSTSGQVDKTFQPFPLLYACCSEDLKILCVLCRTGLGWARLFWCCQARLELRTLCCCLNVSALLGAGMFKNRVLGACVFNSLQASGFMAIQGV